MIFKSYVDFLNQIPTSQSSSYPIVLTRLGRLLSRPNLLIYIYIYIYVCVCLTTLHQGLKKQNMSSKYAWGTHLRFLLNDIFNLTDPMDLVNYIKFTKKLYLILSVWFTDPWGKWLLARYLAFGCMDIRLGDVSEDGGVLRIILYSKVFINVYLHNYSRIHISMLLKACGNEKSEIGSIIYNWCQIYAICLIHIQSFKVILFIMAFNLLQNIYINEYILKHPSQFNTIFCTQHYIISKYH